MVPPPNPARTVLPIPDIPAPGLTTYDNHLIRPEDRLSVAMAIQ